MELRQGPTIADIRRRLEGVGQAHLLHFYEQLTPEGQRSLLAQIAALDLENLPALIQTYVKAKQPFTPPEDLEPAPFYPLKGDWDRRRYYLAGEDALRAGQIAAFTVAGGQGTRLGFDGPKGTFFATAITRKPLFRCLAEWIIAAQNRYQRPIPWYIMTSPLNHSETVAFFKQHGHFGLDDRNVMFFSQGVLPSLEMNSGKLLLAEKAEVATNPDGHGGSLRALWNSGAIEDMTRRGIKHLSYVQIDNPLARVIDPLFIGLHIHAPDSSAEMSSKMVAKSDPGEKVGVFCRAAGKTRVIEYSDLPKQKTEERDSKGSLRFAAGSIAIHIISVDFIARLNAGGQFSLPLHRAEKKVPYIDLATAHHVQPASPNAVKLEAFVFDALPICKASVVLETERIDEFAPIKNAQGNDSPETCRDIQSERAARWLESVGVRVPRDQNGKPRCVLEISPITAMNAEDLRSADLPAAVEPGAELAL